VDACPYLRHREAGPSSALCVPVTVTGKPIGVICAVGPDGTPPDGDVAPVLSLLARKTGERVTLLRSLARTESLASTDPLTGLANRRSLEERVGDLVEQGRSYVVAYGDLDHFKQVNDTNGHDAGDRALRLFARVLRDNVRPGDFPSRYGGEEFVVVLPDCSVSDATTVVERVRARLVSVARDAGVPPFTISVGISAPDGSRPFGEVLGEADAALHAAKRAGRDRVVVAGATSGATTGLASVG
jgi:diguanylate cyclase (GGDEF)-like protein